MKDQFFSKSAIQLLSTVLVLTFLWVGISAFTTKTTEQDTICFNGKVTEIAYDIPIGGVKVKCESASAVTAADGSFTIHVPNKNKEFYKISFSKKGYKSDYLDNVPAKSEKIYLSLMKSR